MKQETLMEAVQRRGWKKTWLCIRTHWSDKEQIGSTWVWWRVWQ